MQKKSHFSCLENVHSKQLLRSPVYKFKLQLRNTPSFPDVAALFKCVRAHFVIVGTFLSLKNKKTNLRCT